jgi:hypothetical protein
MELSGKVAEPIYGTAEPPAYVGVRFEIDMVAETLTKLYNELPEEDLLLTPLGSC